MSIIILTPVKKNPTRQNRSASQNEYLAVEVDDVADRSDADTLRAAADKLDAENGNADHG